MYKILTNIDSQEFNQQVSHPLQLFEWGEFRKKTGVGVVRFGKEINGKLSHVGQMTLHKIPFLPFSIGYIPKSFLPDNEFVEFLKKIGVEKKLVFIKIEPNIEKTDSQTLPQKFIPAYKPLFTSFTFYLDLTLSEDELLKNMHNKTRYNIKVAQKHGVMIQEENTEEAFAHYLALTQETTNRQGFYAHTPKYHQLMWATLHPKGIAHLFTARYRGKILATWILFLDHNVLYYPYGASSSSHREVMASTLMLWETMRWGKLNGAKTYDLWGTPGPNPTPSDPYYGFHRFKMGFGPRLVEFVGSYDLVINPLLYEIVKCIDQFRWKLLKLKAQFKK